MKIVKRDGHIVDYCPDKIESAISKANAEVAEEYRVTDVQIRNIIKYIDQVAKDYCDIVFKTRDLEVYLDGNALDISYCGKMFDNLSGGEKQRVDLILQFAIRYQITANLIVSHSYLSYSFLFQVI